MKEQYICAGKGCRLISTTTCRHCTAPLCSKHVKHEAVCWKQREQRQASIKAHYNKGHVNNFDNCEFEECKNGRC